jgi:hypothetical protein
MGSKQDKGGLDFYFLFQTLGISQKFHVILR